MAVETNVAHGSLFVGADSTWRVTVTDSAGAAQTMTGWALEFVLRKHQSDGKGQKVFSTTTATLSNGTDTDDVASFPIADTDTDNLAPGTYDWSVWRVDSGNETVLAYGTVALTGAAFQ